MKTRKRDIPDVDYDFDVDTLRGANEPSQIELLRQELAEMTAQTGIKLQDMAAIAQALSGHPSPNQPKIKRYSR